MKKQIITLTAIVAVLMAVIFAGCVEKETPVSTQAPTPTLTPTPTPTLTPMPTPSAYILITKKEEGSMLTDYFSTDYGVRDADQGYSFLIMNFAIENQGYKSFTVNLLDFYVIVDKVKYEYDASTYSIPNGLRRVELLDGGTTSGRVVFAIPETDYVEWSWGYETPYNVEFEKEK